MEICFAFPDRFGHVASGKLQLPSILDVSNRTDRVYHTTVRSFIAILVCNTPVDGQPAGHFGQRGQQGVTESAGPVQVGFQVDVRTSASVAPVIRPPERQDEEQEAVHPHAILFRHWIEWIKQ